MRQLPLIVVDQPGGATIRCLCGAEPATLRRGLAVGLQMARTGTGQNRGRARLAADLTTPGLLMMVLHAGRCKRGQAILEAQQRARSGLG